jgi:hypothetical protein
MKLSRQTYMALAVYFCALLAYIGASNTRLRAHTNDNHFAYQAQMFLQHRLDLGRSPPSSNDWAEVTYLHLKDGRTLAGTWLKVYPNRFRTLEGKIELIPNDNIENRWQKYYVSFPPFPAALFLPLVAIWGLNVNDVVFTVLVGALGPMLLFLVLRRLAARGDSQRSEYEDLWLTGMFAFGTVYFYSSVIGQVWYTAHIVSTMLVGLFVLCALDGKRPFLAGVFLGCLVLTRPQMGFWGILFLYEAWRASKGDRREFLRRFWRVAIPVALLGLVGAAFNWARFHSVSEFGHYYLNVRWTERIQRYGLFNYAFLSRNLTAAFTLTPRLLAKAPYFNIGWHGMSLLITTPALAYVAWPRVSGGLHRALWLVVTPIALLGFLYQNDGWVQFGYRFSIDFLFGVMMLLAIGGRKLTRTWQALILVGVVVNLFGAITFQRAPQFYGNGSEPFFGIDNNQL